MVPKLAPDLKYKMLRYEVGFTEEKTGLQSALGDKFDETRSAYGVGGYYYDGLANAVAKLNDFELLELVQKYPTPQAYCKHFR